MIAGQGTADQEAAAGSRQSPSPGVAGRCMAAIRRFDLDEHDLEARGPVSAGNAPIARISNTAHPVVVAFDANNPGLWALHCHLLYHLDAGMFTTLRYV
jgi:hypothetical protein